MAEYHHELTDQTCLCSGEGYPDSRLTRFSGDGRWWVEGHARIMVLSIGHWHQLVAQLCRPALCRPQCPLRILALVVFGTSIHLLLAVPQHGIDQPGQLMRCGGDGLGRTQVRFLPAQEGAQGTVGAVQRVGSQTQCRRRPARAGLGL